MPFSAVFFSLYAKTFSHSFGFSKPHITSYLPWQVLPEYGRLKERLSEVTKQHGDARRERESLESQSRSLSAELSDKIRQMEVRVNEVKYKKQIEITEIR